MKKRPRGIIGIVFLLMLMMVGCSDGGVVDDLVAPNPEATDYIEEQIIETETAVTHDGVMKLAMNVPTTLNPLYGCTESVQQALFLIFSPLVNIEEDGTISANLAESWMVGDAGTSVVVTLKSGITWHDGTPLTSDDVLYTLEQIKAIPDSPYRIAVDNIMSAERIDTLSFKIIYKNQFSSVLQTLFFPVIPKHIYENESDNQTTMRAVGTGPYKLTDISAQKSMGLEANENYFKGAPRIKQIEVTIIPDEESSLYAFKQGLIDVVYTHMTDWGKYTNRKGTSSYEMTSNIYEFMGLNLNKTIFQNKNVREALIYGIDRQDMVHRYYLDHAIVTDTPISPVSYLYDKTLEIKAYNKERAKLLLTKEGYEKDTSTGLLTKNSVAFSFSLLVNKENTDRIKIAYEMKEMYKEIGIEMTIEEVESKTYLERIKNKQFDAFLGGFKLAYATDLSFALHSSSVLSGDNYVGYKDEQMDNLLREAFVSGEDQKEEVYSRFQKYFAEQNPYISLYFKKSVVITSSGIKGVVNPTPLNIFANVEDWSF